MTEILGVNPLAAHWGSRDGHGRRRGRGGPRDASCGRSSMPASRRARSATSSAPTRSATTLAAAGIAITDTPSGAQWSLVRPARRDGHHREEGLNMPGNSQRRGAVRKGGKKPDRRLRWPAPPRARGQGPHAQGVPSASTTPPTSAATSANAARRRGPAGQRPGRRRPWRVAAPAAGQGHERDGLRPQLRRRGAARQHPRVDDVPRQPHRHRRPGPRGAQARDRARSRRSSRRRAASSTGSTDGGVHQGLALQVPPYDYADPPDLIDPEMPGIPLVVALDGITDPRNLGAIIRSVAAFGGHGVVVPERRSVGMTASAWKTSAGAAARIPVAKARQPHAGARGVQEGRLLRARARHGRRRRAARPVARRPSRSSSSPARRARACRGSCARPATRSSRSR